MFRHDRLHAGWIAKCTRYVHAVFGDRLDGATVLDYGFGRGNWSVALRQAGAARVVAVDAAAGNVSRFSDFLRREGISGIEPVHGDVLREPLSGTVDHVWLYGVLHHVAQPRRLLQALSAAAPGPRASFLVYAYDQGSVRETIVSLVRDCLLYADEASFSRASGLFCPAARLRARDDLTAPVIDWYSLPALRSLLHEQGWGVTGYPPDFPVFLGQPPTGEFAPHHLLCRRGAGDAPEPGGAAGFAADCSILRALWRDLEALHPAERMADIGVGLFNAHFAALSHTGRAEEALMQGFLHLAFQCEAGGAKAQSDLSARARSLAAASAADRPRTDLARSLPGTIALRLARQTIRF